MSDIIGKPVSSGPQAVNFVFYEDKDTILVDLSGAIPGADTKRRSTGLDKVTNSIYRDPVDKSLYIVDVSGTDVSAGKLKDYKLKFFFANNNGLVDLSYNSPSNFALPMPNLIDLAFSDASGNPYYTKYQSIYGDGFDQDISLYRFTSTLGDISANRADISANAAIDNASTALLRAVDVSGYGVTFGAPAAIAAAATAVGSATSAVTAFSNAYITFNAGGYTAAATAFQDASNNFVTLANAFKDLSKNFIDISNSSGVVLTDGSKNAITLATTTARTSLATSTTAARTAAIAAARARFFQDDLSNNLVKRFSVTQEKINFLDISLSTFDNNDNILQNPTTIDISLGLGTNFLFKTDPSSDAFQNDVSGNFKINFNPFGVPDLSVNLISTYSAATTKIFKIPVNTLVSGAKISITNNTAKVQENINNGFYPKPAQPIATLFKTEYIITTSGSSILEIPITIPANTAGSWVWNMKLTNIVNGLTIVSPVTTLNVAVFKSFNPPVVSSIYNLSSVNLQSKLTVRLADVDYNEDISKGFLDNSNNKLSYALRLVPRPYYNISATELLDISKCFTIKRNVETTNLLNVVNDISNIQFSQETIRAEGISLELRGSDLSQNAGSTIWTKRKTADVSDNYLFDLCNNNIHLLRERNYNVAIDWMNYNDKNDALNNKVSTIITPLTVDTLFPGQVNVQFEKSSGSIVLSMDNPEGVNSSCKYKVIIYSDSTLRSQATNDLEWQKSTQSLNTFVTQSSANLYNFDVTIGTNFVSNVYLPKQTSTRKLYLVAYVKDSTTSALTHKYTHSATIPLTDLNTVELKTNFYTTTFKDVCQNIISEPILFQDDPTLDPSTFLENPNLTPVPVDLSGYVITDIQQATDLSFNITRPNWWKEIINPSLTISINDPNGIVDSFDISGQIIKTTAKQSITTFNQYDLSNNFFLDLSFNKLATDSFFRLNFVFTDGNNASYPKASQSILIYYSATEVARQNKGAITNTFITYNDIKLTLNNAIGVTAVNNLVLDGFGTFPWVAGSANNMYNLNLARSEFIGEDNHVLDLSGMTIEATRQDCSGTQVFAYFAVTDGAGKLDTSANIINTSAVTGVKHITGRFLSYPHSYLYIRKFIGTIDIKYTTVNKYLKPSATQNTLRIVVLPRPNPIIETIFVPAVGINTVSNFNINITNMQRDTVNGYDLTSLNNWSVGSLYSRDLTRNNKVLGNKIATMTNLSSGIVTVTPLASDNLFVKPLISTSILSYGNPHKVTGSIRFLGKSTVGAFTQTLNLSMNRFDSKSLSTSSSFTVTVFNGSTFTENMLTKNATVNSLLNFAGFDFLVYKTINNATTAEELDLLNHPSTKNAAFIVITNNGSGSITAGGIAIPAGSTVVIRRNGETTLEFLYTKI
jgi:hypothetical protein